MTERIAIPCTIMRGGTSKAVFLREEALPPPGHERDRLILAIFGSPDRRQIDGLGGAEPLTSKLAIIGAPRVPQTDLTYTFGQVEIETPEIDYLSLCGNISSAVGHYAVDEGFVPPVEPLTTVRVFTTNLNRTLRIEVPVRDGRPFDDGDYRIPGVPGTAAKITLDFADTAGGATGKLLPTGNPVDVLDVPGVGRIEASLVDIGNAHVFVRARDMGMTGTETPAEIDKDPALLERFERIRRAGLEKMKMRPGPATPIIGAVAPPAAYVDHLGGETIQAEDVDLLSRLMYMQITHKTYAGTSTVCTGVAAKIAGSIVYEAIPAAARERLAVRIGHPAGVIETESRVEPSDGGPVVTRATFGRTARRIMQGTVFVRAGVAERALAASIRA